MSRVAVIDHSFHEKTGSSKFFHRLLLRHEDVEILWDDSWKTGRVSRDLVERVVQGSFDVVVFWQVRWSRALVESLGLGGAILIPMFDEVHRKPDRWWSEWSDFRFVSFSREMARRIRKSGADVFEAQYFPEVAETMPERSGGLSGFFWQRRKDLPWSVVNTLASGTEWESFHLHWVPDPGHARIRKPDTTAGGIPSRVTEWFEDAGEFDASVSAADVYFAPRIAEGIGMGFLGAMARGQCIVAPDFPTHNEYLDSGETGLLYDPKHPVPLDLGHARRIGAAARESCDLGRMRWEQQREELLEFVLGPSAPPDRTRGCDFLKRHGRSSSVFRLRDPVWKRAIRRLGKLSGPNPE